MTRFYFSLGMCKSLLIGYVVHVCVDSLNYKYAEPPTRARDSRISQELTVGAAVQELYLHML